MKKRSDEPIFHSQGLRRSASNLAGSHRRNRQFESPYTKDFQMRNSPRVSQRKRFDMEEKMERFQFTSRLANGMDIKTAGEFVKEAIRCSGKVTIRNGLRKGDAKLIFNVMSLNIKEGDVIEIEVDGGNEKEDAASLKKFAEEHC